MKKIKLLGILLVMIWYPAAAELRDTTFMESPIKVSTDNGELSGTLTLSDRGPGGPVALIISGSGPTDRNGNSILTQNNAYQMLAREMANLGVASVRYDKRGVGQSYKAMRKESEMSFEDYIKDAVAWIELLKKDGRFKSVIVIGHSEGSLIGMVAAARAGADKYVSVSGGGRPIYEVLKEQFKAADTALYNLGAPVIDSLKQGYNVKNIDRKLMMYFRPSVQPFLISWMKYDPRVEIKKLKIPAMIIQGTTDIQVSMEDARNLKAALPAAKLVVIQNMNHVLKIVEGDREANKATYSEPMRPLAPTLAETIVKFISS
jgi:pimeloyl-ACP methyl ester carboxylesterase